MKKLELVRSAAPLQIGILEKVKRLFGSFSHPRSFRGLGGSQTRGSCHGRADDADRRAGIENHVKRSGAIHFALHINQLGSDLHGNCDGRTLLSHRTTKRE